jgi:hypothetical protein
VAEAVGWGWERFTLSSEALALDPAGQAVDQLQLWLLERWDVTVRSIDAVDRPSAGGGREGASRPSNRETLAWYDGTTVFVPTARLGEASGGALKPEALARALDDRGLLTRRTDAKRLAVRYVAGLGRGSWYALCRKAFGRRSEPEPAFKVHEGGRS